MKLLSAFICFLVAFPAAVPAQEPTIKSVWDKALVSLDTFVANGTMSLSKIEDDGTELIREVDFHWEKDGVNFFVELRRTASKELGLNQLDQIVPYRSTVVGNSETISGFDFIRKHPLGGTGFISPRKRTFYPNQHLLVAFDVHSGVQIFFPPELTELIGNTKISSITREAIKVNRKDESFLVFIDPITNMLIRSDAYKASPDGNIKTTSSQTFYPDVCRPKSLRIEYFSKAAITTTCRLDFAKFELIKPEREFKFTESEAIPGASIMDESRVRP